MLPLRTLAHFFFGTWLISSLASAAPEVIERLVVVYSPVDDADSLNFSYSTLRSGILRAAQDKKMEVVVINADEVAPGKSLAERRQALLDAIDSSVHDGTKSWVWVATHGVPKSIDGSDKMANFQPGDERDTNLSFMHADIPYGEIAAKLDKYNSVKGIYLDACFGYCKILEDQCHSGSGKCVISSAHRLVGTDAIEASKVEKELAAMIGGEGPQRPQQLSAKFPDQSANGYSGDLNFGPSARPGIRDPEGKSVNTCKSFNPKYPNIYLPGRGYPPEQFLAAPDLTRNRRSIAEEPLAAFAKSYNFFCLPTGKWKLEPKPPGICEGSEIALRDCNNLSVVTPDPTHHGPRLPNTDRNFVDRQCDSIRKAVDHAKGVGIDLSYIDKKGFCFPNCSSGVAVGRCLKSGIGNMCWPTGHFGWSDESVGLSGEYVQARACCLESADGGSAHWNAARGQCDYVCVDEDGSTAAEGSCFSPRLPGPTEEINFQDRAGYPVSPTLKKVFVCEKNQSRVDRACCEKAGGIYSPSAVNCYRSAAEIDPAARQWDKELHGVTY